MQRWTIFAATAVGSHVLHTGPTRRTFGPESPRRSVSRQFSRQTSNATERTTAEPSEDLLPALAIQCSLVDNTDIECLQHRATVTVLCGERKSMLMRCHHWKRWHEWIHGQLSTAMTAVQQIAIQSAEPELINLVDLSNCCGLACGPKVHTYFVREAERA